MLSRCSSKYIVAVLLLAMPLVMGSICQRTVERNGVRVTVEEAERLDYAEAERAMEEKDYEKAAEQYQEFIDEWPRSERKAQALVGMGEAYYRQGNCEKASLIFRDAIDQYPGGPEAAGAAWGLSLCAYGDNDCGRVSELAERYRGQAEGQDWDRFTMLWAECRVKNDDFEGAYRLYGEEVRNGRSDRFVTMARGKAELLGKQLDEEVLKDIATDHPDAFPGDLALMELIARSLENDELEKAREYAKLFEDNYPETAYQDDFDKLNDMVSRWSKVKPNRIGALLPLSGNLAAFGQAALKGVMLAGAVFDESDPLFPADIVVRDTSGPDVNIEAMVDELVNQDHVIAIVGPLQTSLAQRAAQTAERLGVPMITMSPGEGMADLGEFVYQNAMTKSDQVGALIDYAMVGQGLTSFAIIYPDDNYGREFYGLFAGQVIERGGSIPSSASYRREDTDFKEQIKMLKEAQKDTEFEAVFIPDSWVKVAMIAPQIRYYRLTGTRLLGINSWHSETLLEKTQPDDLEGAAFTDGIEPDSDRPSWSAFRRAFTAEFGHAPGILEAQAYDGVTLLLGVINNFHVRDRAQLKKALDHVADHAGALGSITIEPSGKFRRPVYIYVIGEEGFRLVQRVE